MGSFGSRGGIRHVVPVRQNAIESHSESRECSLHLPLETVVSKGAQEPFIDLRRKESLASVSQFDNQKSD